MEKSQIAINSVSTGDRQLEEIIPAYAEAGFRNVEFPLGQVKDYLQRAHTIPEINQLLEKHDMRCIGGFEGVLQCFSPKRADNHAQVIDNARLFADLGGTNLVVGTDGPPHPVAPDDLVAQIATVFAELAEKIHETGVTLCLEFNWSPIVKSVRTACDVARRSQMDNVGVVFDPAHYHCTPSKLDQLNAANVPFIRHVHVNDMRDKPGELSNCNTDRLLPGHGCLDLNRIFGEIEKHGYLGYFSIEMFNEELRAMPVQKAATLMYESMKQLCDR